MSSLGNWAFIRPVNSSASHIYGSHSVSHPVNKAFIQAVSLELFHSLSEAVSHIFSQVFCLANMLGSQWPSGWGNSFFSYLHCCRKGCDAYGSDSQFLWGREQPEYIRPLRHSTYTLHVRLWPWFVPLSFLVLWPLCWGKLWWALDSTNGQKNGDS